MEGLLEALSFMAELRMPKNTCRAEMRKDTWDLGSSMGDPGL